jgi:hypothetical protein
MRTVTVTVTLNYKAIIQVSMQYCKDGHIKVRKTVKLSRTDACMHRQRHNIIGRAYKTK